MTDSVKVEGLKELRTALLTKIPLHMQGKVLQGALAAGARQIIATARQLAPEKTGKLKRAIYSFRDGRNSNRTLEVRSIRPRTKGKLDAFYWRFVEFGHRIVRKGFAKVTRRLVRQGNVAGIAVVPPKPFMRPAFESQKMAALNAIVAGLKKQLERAAKLASWKTSADRGAGSARGALSDLNDLFDRIG